MPLDPFIENYLRQSPPAQVVIADFPAYRSQDRVMADAIVERVAEPGPEIAQRQRFSIAVNGGTIDLLVFTPRADGPLPVHLYLHGGGWALGSIDYLHVDIVCRERCVGARCVVVAVDYRKAPEHKFPIPLADCMAALQWVADNAIALGVRADAITVGGQSAGANLAAALALKVRDEGGPAIGFQLLEVPSLDLTFSQPSHSAYATGYMLTRQDMEGFRAAYLHSDEDMTHPFVSPLLADDLTGLPPAHLMAAEYDPLRDDALAYAHRLHAAGVAAFYSLQRGHIHVSGGLTQVMESARAWRAESIGVLALMNSALICAAPQLKVKL